MRDDSAIRALMLIEKLDSWEFSQRSGRTEASGSEFVYSTASMGADADI
jgi:hypothetical protein